MIRTIIMRQDIVILSHFPCVLSQCSKLLLAFTDFLNCSIIKINIRLLKEKIHLIIDTNIPLTSNPLTDNSTSKNWKYLLPISLIVFLVPLIVYLKLVDLSPIEIGNWTGREEVSDLFSYYKMIVLNLLAILSIIFTCFYFKQTRSKIKKTKIYIPMIVYGLFIVLSTLLTDHKLVAIRGFVYRYEGMLTLLSYLIIMFVTINIVKGEKSLKAIVYPLIGSAAIIGIIGIFQYIGYDLFQSDLGKKMILPRDYWQLADSLKFNFGKNTIYSTLYNPNYVGSYMAILLPMTLAILILSKTRRNKLIILPFTILIFLSLVGSNSRGGILGTLIALLVFLIFIRKQILKQWKIVLLALIILSIGIFAVNKISNGRLTNQLTNLKNDMVKLMGGGEKESLNDGYKIEEVSVKDNVLKIETTRQTLKVENKNGKIYFFDGDGNLLKIKGKSKTGEMNILDERYSEFKFRVIKDGENSILTLNLQEYIARFVLIEETFKYYRGIGVFNEIREIPYFGFEGKEELGTYRGYIWSRTLPMLKENLIVGKGPDTYTIYFPQEDFKGRFNVQAFPNREIIDKPHNMYLQIATNTGLISLLGFLGIFLIYLYQSVRIYFKNILESDLEIFGIGIFIGVISYLIAGIFNDSVVSVAPVFWAIIGTGVAINLEIERLADNNISNES